jgi:Holliday junction resolvasome RuvABC endonuclease subunit
MSNFNILALDCAQKTGWATLINGHIESGVQDFTKKRGESNGFMFMRFNAWLDGMRLLSYFNLIVFEQSHHRGGYATEIGVGLTTRAQEFACRNGAEHMAVHSMTLKKFVTGSGKASKSDIMEWFMKKTGRVPISDDEADSMALLYYACDQIGEKINPLTVIG